MTVHRTIGMKPIQVNKNNEKHLLITVYKQKNTQPITITPFKSGDRVRISTNKKTTENKYKHNWSREIFVISKIQYTCRITYKIKDLNGEEIHCSFYKYELFATAL